MKNISNIVNDFKTYGLMQNLWFIQKKLIGNRIRNFKLYQNFKNKCGIEIGGPSSFFTKEVPLYRSIKSLDGVNFSSNTIWEGELIEGDNYNYCKDNIGYQFICDSVDLNRIVSEKYDFVLSCNNLEHISNPYKAIKEWLRVIKSGGLLFLVLPNKKSNFDHKRNTTTIDHINEDFLNNVSEGDLTHLDEILTLHDLSMDPPAGDFNNFKRRSINNFQNRCLHHHVYDMPLLEQIFKSLNIEILVKDSAKKAFIIVGRKICAN